jgi:hypothetical protein
MDTRGFKKLIKEAVREAIQEELKDILLEAVRAPKTIVKESYAAPITNQTPTPATADINAREKYREILGGMMDARNGNLNLTSENVTAFGGAQPYRPPASANTTGEGSSLPPGEVSLDQLMGFMNKK